MTSYPLREQRAAAGWTTPVSAETAALVADALDAYAPPPPAPPTKSPDSRFSLNAYMSGSAIYSLGRDGEISEVVAWAQNSLAANAAFDVLVRNNPQESYMQKRKSWVERESVGGECKAPADDPVYDPK
ncbi:MAG: hypothetical protein WA973_14875 [Mesorhizobium sp.]